MPDLDFEKITLNAIPDGEMPVFHASQFETMRRFMADLKWGSEDFAPAEGCRCTLAIRKTDDTLVIIDDIDIDNNTVSCILTQQSVACIGDNFCQLKVWATSEDDEDGCIACLNFILHVQPDPEAGGITSESEINNLTEQIEEITQQVIGDDYYDKTEVDGLLAGKADQATTYTKSEVDTALNLKADKATTYTKTQVDSALALKANSADLATVATTGDYDDLINKPTIPAAQVQSDYAQADNTQVDYIKNKPDIDGMIANALLAVMPVGTESGPIATFDTEIAAPLVNVSCDIVATGGNGTPDNPKPINGYSEANITRCGMNLWDEEWELGSINPTTGTPFNDPNRIRSKNYSPIKGGIEIYSLDPTNNYNIRLFYYDADKNFIGASTWVGNQTSTTLTGACYFKFIMGSSYGTTYNHDISVLYPSSEHNYRPYNGQTYAIAFGQTVYGGVLDVTRGKLHVTHNIIDMGSINWNKLVISASVTGYQTTTAPTGIKPNTDNNTVPDILCEVFEPDTVNHGYTGYNPECLTENVAGLVTVYTQTDYADGSAFKTAMTGMKFAYPLATPFDIDLTPAVISAIIGSNNVSSDTGDTTVQFKDSIQHYIDTRV